MRSVFIVLGQLEVLQTQGHQFVPVATFKQDGRTVAADPLNKTGVTVVDRGGISHGDGGTGKDRSGCRRHGSVADGSGAIIDRVRSGWHGGDQGLAHRRQDRWSPGAAGGTAGKPRQ